MWTGICKNQYPHDRIRPRSGIGWPLKTVGPTISMPTHVYGAFPVVSTLYVDNSAVTPSVKSARATSAVWQLCKSHYGDERVVSQAESHW